MKWFQSIFICADTGMMAETHNFVNPSAVPFAKYLRTNITDVSRGVSLVLITLGISTILTSPTARIWEK
jgi:hypothetical protein